MNVVIALVIFIVGGIGGFLAARFLSTAGQEQRKLAEQVSKSEAALDQYKLDVAEHLSSSASLLNQMNSTCQTAMKQMQESTQLLQRATTVDVEGVPFFAAETQQQLEETATLRRDKRSTEVINEAPLDYSGSPSGLFANQTQKVTTEE